MALLSEQVNDALSTEAGQALVDAMDDKLFAVVREEVESSIAVAAQAKLSIEPVAVLYIALWVNMTGSPNTLNRWLSGTSEMGLAPPSGGSLSAQNMEKYLSCSSYFQIHPKNLLHMKDAVQAGASILQSIPSPSSNPVLVPPPSTSTQQPTLQFGAQSEHVLVLQALLSARGCLLDGMFGEQTLAAVRQFQRSRGLPDSGIVEAPTWNALLKV